MERKEYEWVKKNREVLLDFCVDSNGFTREMGFLSGRLVEGRCKPPSFICHN
ncbi:hypothetical protein DFO73_101704 [Cytobacillus oceanisediminis]|uniref:Uncharacterized protein n=1 Tax=Cytobacillus oceanisediminis TaxID=665099 RepID=A0A2V3A6B8_9BACI|nr:hypothetical protein DFO73_101704 [Cytobacillus oceanisediminis]